MYLNEILPGNWREDEWPEHIEVAGLGEGIGDGARYAR